MERNHDAQIEDAFRSELFPIILAEKDSSYFVQLFLKFQVFWQEGDGDYPSLGSGDAFWGENSFKTVKLRTKSVSEPRREAEGGGDWRTIGRRRRGGRGNILLGILLNQKSALTITWNKCSPPTADAWAFCITQHIFFV